VRYYGIMATDPGLRDIRALLSMVTARRVAGNGIFTIVTMFSVLVVLCLSANYVVAIFRGCCRMIARDDYLPHSLATRGRRLVFSQGIWALAILGGALADFVSRSDGSVDSFVCGGGVLASLCRKQGMVGHWGGQRRDSSGARDADQRHRRFGHGDHGDGDCGGEVCRGGVGVGGDMLVAGNVGVHGRVRRHYERVGKGCADECNGPESAKLDAPIVIVRGPMECGNGEGAAVCDDAVSGCGGVACDVRRDEDRPTWKSGGRSAGGDAGSEAGDIAVAVSLVVHPDRGLCVEGGEGECGSDGRGGDCTMVSGTGITIFCNHAGRC